MSDVRFGLDFCGIRATCNPLLPRATMLVSSDVYASLKAQHDPVQRRYHQALLALAPFANLATALGPSKDPNRPLIAGPDGTFITAGQCRAALEILESVAAPPQDGAGQ